jgi:hypothetical protein
VILRGLSLRNIAQNLQDTARSASICHINEVQGGMGAKPPVRGSTPAPRFLYLINFKSAVSLIAVLNGLRGRREGNDKACFRPSGKLNWAIELVN